MRPNTRPSYIYYIVLAIAFVLFGAMFYLHPYLLDDEWYMRPMSAYVNQPTLSNFLSGWADSISEHFYCDNGRIGNMIGTALLAAPRSIMAAILGASVALAIASIAVAAGVWRRNFLIFSAIVSLYALAMPWHGYMFCRMFSFNYQIPTFLTFGILYLVLNDRLNKWWFAMIAGLLTSAWNEAFGAPLLAGVATLMLIGPRYRSRANFILCASLLTGLIYISLVPGAHVRSSNFQFFQGFKQPFAGLHLAVPYILYIAIQIAALCNTKWRRQLEAPALVAIFVMGIVSLIIWRIFFNGGRLAWCLDASAIVGIALLARSCPYELKPEALRVAASLILLLAPATQLTAAIPYTASLDRQVEEYYDQVGRQPLKSEFFKFTEPWEQPVYLGGKPNFNLLRTASRKTLYYIPETLRHYTHDKAIPLPGNNCGARLWEEHYIVLPYIEQLSDMALSAQYTMGSENYLPSFFIPFTTDSGEKYLFCHPYQLRLSLARKPITSFSFDISNAEPIAR